jgi:glycerophosphoryl diester phosphodiesterase
MLPAPRHRGVSGARHECKFTHIAPHATGAARIITAMHDHLLLRIAVACSFVVVAAFVAGAQGRAGSAKQNIAHRGASAYAPEHTLTAYRLSMVQGVDFVEQDLAVTKDGVLICLHDDTLERTSDVATVFPDRFSKELPGRGAGRGPARRYVANDFTLAEIRKLDMGRWFSGKFMGERIVTWDEAIELVRGRPGTGMYPELKSPPLYTARGVDMAKIFVDSVKKHGLDRPESLKTTPIIIQSFDEATIRRVAAELPGIPRVFLTSEAADVTGARLKELAGFATGIAPEKGVIAAHPEMVAAAHALTLTVTSWTFRTDEKTSQAAVRDEMAHFLYDLGIDALFTNNPDLFPRRQ